MPMWPQPWTVRNHGVWEYSMSIRLAMGGFDVHSEWTANAQHRERDLQEQCHPKPEPLTPGSKGHDLVWMEYT